ncbi:MAG: NAD kinase [Flavobacteriaceae bacterium]|nr:NAD kinase [Flavobacteriaceae bacterium]
MKVAIFGQYKHENTVRSVRAVEEILSKNSAEAWMEKKFFNLIKDELEDITVPFNTFSELDSSFDYLITVGGDGTMLRAVTYVKDLMIPVVGINTGRLGFLATIQMDNISQSIESILNKNYKISERTLLTASTDPPNKDLQDIDFALNEIAVSRRNTTSMISVETHLNDEYLTSYWADGLIIATPTGSTGYSLSCGGPVITPGDDSLVLTPIAPHNLNARPLVISSDTTIKLKVSGREDNYLISLDSRIATLDNSTIVTIKRAPFKIHLIELENETFIDTLRKKMLWGEDRRN